MHRISTLLLSAFSLCLSAPTLFANATLPSIFNHHMVLQRDQAVPVWGWADAGESVRVSFAGQTVEATADAKGEWRVDLAAMPANAVGSNFTITANNTITFSNVVVGEVWICSGQSNMEWTMNAVDQGPEKSDHLQPDIRHAKIPHMVSGRSKKDVPTQWQICTPETVGGFTAVGTYFARRLHQELSVPVGLIGCNWGGTRVEPWIAPVGYACIPSLQTTYQALLLQDPTTAEGYASHTASLEAIRNWLTTTEKALEEGSEFAPQPRLPSEVTNHQAPSALYHAMVAPLIPYAIRGAIWYQGESNGDEGDSYFQKKKALIEGWRSLWSQGDFPFYFVQLANFRAPNSDPAGGDSWTQLREAQRKTLTLPNTGMAVITDIGEANNIHPRNKFDVGERLALWALANDYGQTDLVYSGPLYTSRTIEEGKIRIHFDHVGSGLMVGKKTGLTPTAEVTDGTLAHFAVAGDDRTWHWADAVIDGDSVLVSSTNVPAPVAVRYAYAMNPEGANLYNKEGLPASPFRTDDW